MKEQWAKRFLVVIMESKYKNVNTLSRELIDSLIDNIYVYEDKKSELSLNMKMNTII